MQLRYAVKIPRDLKIHRTEGFDKIMVYLSVIIQVFSQYRRKGLTKTNAPSYDGVAFSEKFLRALFFCPITKPTKLLLLRAFFVY